MRKRPSHRLGVSGQNRNHTTDFFRLHALWIFSGISLASAFFVFWFYFLDSVINYSDIYDDQVINHGISKEAVERMLNMAHDFFGLPLEEKLKLYSDDPSKTMRLSTSFNVNKEKVHNWRDYLRLHCYPLHKYVPEWPSNPPSFK